MRVKVMHCQILLKNCSFFKFKFIYFNWRLITLQYCIGFAIHQRAPAPVGVFSRGTTRISGSLSCGAREVRSPCAWRGGARPGSRVTGGD